MSDPLSIASGIAGLVTHADAVFSNVYQYAKAVQNAEKEIKELVATVQSLSGLLHSLALVLAELEKDTTESNFRLHHINSCRATLSKIQRKLNANDDSSTLDGRIERALRKLKWPFSQPETKQLVVEIEQHKATINVALSADGLSATLRALSRQDDLKEEFENMRAEIKTKWAMETHITLGKERRKVLAFFGKSDPTFSHEASLRLRHPLTGLWVSEGAIFKTWLYTRNSKLWLSGIPGAGKTVLAASLIEEAVNESSSARAVAYFYCDYKDVEKQFPVNIMGSLAVQLARQNEEAFILLQELYKTCSVEDQPPHPPRLSSLEETLYQMTTCFEDVSIIIDGLDECGNNVSTLVESITSLVSPDESNTRLLVLSRDLYEIRGLLLSSQNFSHLDIAAQSEDLKLYVAAEIDARLKRFGKNQLRIKSPELKAHILETLVDRADGMFRWVACQLDYLCGLPGDKEKRQALMSLPPDLNKTYERILEAVDHSEKSAQRLVKATLQWIVHGMKPLTVDALCEAISLKSGDTTLDSEGIYDEEDILLHCSSLIRRSAEGSYFELAHFTVKEFLEGISPESPFASYSQTESYVYPQLAATCLTYVNLEIFHDDVVEDDEKWDAQQKERPFRQHAVSNWLGYMKHSWDKEDVVSLARRLFDPSKTVAFLAWTRDYFLFDDEWDVDDEVDFFETITSAVCIGGVTPLHIAAATGCPELCGWLIQSSDDLNQNSELGTPIHCTLIGVPGLLASFNSAEWLYRQARIQFNVKGRSEVLKMLIQEGCDLAAAFTDHRGAEFSCSMLALYANMNQGRDHPLISLVAGGCKLDQGLLTSFEEKFDTGIFAEETMDKKRFEEFLDGLVAALEVSSDNQDIKDDLFNLALRSRTSKAQQLIRGNDESSNLGLEKIHDLFYRAIRFDQIELVEDLLRSGQADMSFMFDGDDSTPLHIAVQWESINSTRLFLSMGASVEAITSDGLTPLHVAVQSSTRDSGCILALLDRGASLSSTEPVLRRNVWHMAVDFADANVLKLLFERDDKDATTLDSPDANGLNPLLYAASLRSEENFEFLLAHASTTSISQKSSDGIGLLHYVVGMNSIDALELLDEKGVMFDDITEDGRNALHFLPTDVSFDVVRFLVGKRVSPSLCSADGLTPLHRFLREEISDDSKVLELLANEEALSKMNEDGYTPLHYAIGFSTARNGSYSFVVRKAYVSALVGIGADINLRTKNGTSAIKLAFDCYGIIKKQRYAPEQYLFAQFLDLLESIIQAVTNQSVLNEVFTWEPVVPGPTSLICWAISIRSDTIIELLLSKAVDLEADLAEKLISALEQACLSGTNENLFRKILSLSKKKHGFNSYGYYLAHVACSRNSRAETYHLKALSEAGVDLFKHQTAVEGKLFLGQTPLMLAVANGNAKLAAFLLDSGADATAKEVTGWTALNLAISSGDISVVQALARSKSDWNATVKVIMGPRITLGCNPLHQAVLRQSVEIVRYIIKGSFVPDIDARTTSDYSALHLATFWGTPEVLELLIDAGADIEAKFQPSGGRAIHGAINCKRPDTLQVLLRHGCQLNADSQGMTPELFAFRSGNKELIRIIQEHTTRQEIVREQQELDLEVSANAFALHTQDRNTFIDHFKSRALLHAIRAGNLDLCKDLVSSGANIKHPSSNCTGCTPLLIALCLGKFPIARYFIENGAYTLGRACDHEDCDAKAIDWDYMEYTAVHLVCRHVLYNDLLPMLLAKDAAAGSPSYRGSVTPLHIAVSYNNLGAVKTLLEYARKQGRPTEDEDQPHLLRSYTTNGESSQIYDQKTLAMWHIDYLTFDASVPSPCLEWLLYYNHETKESLTTENIQTASGLHLAASSSRGTGMAEFLLANGANINLQNQQRNSALHLAAYNERIKTLDLLIRQGANVNARNTFGTTPAMYAAQVGSVEALRFLRKGGASMNAWDEWGRTAIHYAASESPSAFSFLFYENQDPYEKDYDRDSALMLVIHSLKSHLAFLSLLCNLDIDYGRCPELIALFPVTSKEKLRLLLKRFPERLVSSEIRRAWKGKVRGSILNQAVRRGRDSLLEMLVKAGASIECEQGDDCSPLLTACSYGREDAMKYLTRVGANMFGIKDGKVCTALQAAKPFPQMVQWLLVGRHTDQKKLTAAEYSRDQSKICDWSGPRMAEVIIKDFYELTAGASSRRLAKELSRLSRNLRGRVVVVRSLL